MTYDINDPLNLSDIVAKECVICNEKDHQEDILETPEGFAHRTCIDEQDVEHDSEVNNEKLL